MDRRIEKLGKQHDRANFRCGNSDIDRWLKKFSLDNQERFLSGVHVLTPDGITIHGFFSLSSVQMDLASLPVAVQDSLPKGMKIPAALIGRLGVDNNHKKKGLGPLLVQEACKLALSIAEKGFGCAYVIVEAKNAKLAEWYQNECLFELSPSKTNYLYLSMRDIKETFSDPEGVPTDFDEMVIQSSL